MNNKKIIGVIIVLICLNIFLLYLNMDLQTQVENITKESTSWEFEDVGKSMARITHTDVSDSSDSLFLMIFLTDKGCMSSVVNEIRNINEFQKKFKNNLQVYVMAEDTSYFEQFYISFPIKQISSKESLLNHEFDFVNPVAMVVDGNGIIHEISMSEVGEPQKRNLFYSRMNSLFESIE